MKNDFNVLERKDIPNLKKHINEWYKYIFYQQHSRLGYEE